MTEDDFASRIPAYRARVQGVMARFIAARNTQPGKLADAISYTVSSDGKRIRPLLTYATAELLEVPAEVADYPAAAIELIHTYSLVHDDVPAMDNADLRRGRPTVHQQFDEATAILVGDALQTFAFELLSHAVAPPDIIVAWTRRLAEAAGATGMVLGQAIDIEGESRPLALQELEAMHRGKTGALITASLVLPALASDPLPDQTLSQLARFGHHIGLAFQIRDDILDVEVTTAQLGKPSGSDARNEKSTFATLLGVRESRSRMYQSLASADTALDALEQALGKGADGLRWLSRYITEREY